MEKTLTNIHNEILAANKVILVSHRDPDGDTFGSATALAEYLLQLKKDFKIYCSTPVPPKLRFLPNPVFTSELSVFDDETQKERLYTPGSSHLPALLTGGNLAILLDCGDIKQAGFRDMEDARKKITGKIINIDHHATNAGYGDLNLIMPGAASTTEIIFHFFKHNNIRVNHNMATSLLTGIITDTGNLFYPSASESTFKTAGELLRAGANWNAIQNWTAKDKSLNLLKLWGVALGRLKTMEETEIAYTYLALKDMKEFGVSEMETDGIANFLNQIDGAKISLFLKETAGGKIKGSLRATRDDVDVSVIAKKLGGGGHKKAAGFMIDGTVQDALDKIIAIQKEK